MSPPGQHRLGWWTRAAVQAGLATAGLSRQLGLGAGLAWTAPTAYLLAGAYALYTDWHPPTLSTPWIWPARPPLDRGAGRQVGAALGVGGRRADRLTER